MKTIYKYPIKGVGAQAIPMPEGAKILTVQVQGDTPCLWALVEVDAPPRDRVILVYGTSHPADEAEAERYIGTFQLSGGPLVFHVFEDADPT